MVECGNAFHPTPAGYTCWPAEPRLRPTRQCVRGVTAAMTTEQMLNALEVSATLAIIYGFRLLLRYRKSRRSVWSREDAIDDGCTRLAEPRHKKLPAVIVYHLNVIVNGDAKTLPIGIIPRFSKDYEAEIRKTHDPSGASYINVQFGDTAAILFWANDGIDAISFLSAEDARAFPGFSPFPDGYLARVDRELTQFPR